MARKKESKRLIAMPIGDEQFGRFAIIRCSNPVTTCEIIVDYDKPGWRIEAHGMARRKPEDKYDMMTGAKKALASAMRNGHFMEHTRKRIWETFLTKYPAKPVQPEQEKDTETDETYLLYEDGSKLDLKGVEDV